GAKLAAPEREVIVTVGDGSYMFGNPVPYHYVARAENLPTLTVVANNQFWLAVRQSTLDVFPDGHAAKANVMALTELKPSPDYEKVIETCGGRGERVEGPGDLVPALRRGLEAVRAGTPVALNVQTQARRELRGTAALEKTQTPQARSFNAYDRPHDDLREFIARAERAGEIVRITGADWKLEMGTLAEIVNHARPEPPAILFEEVPGYPKGMRLLSGATNSSKRLAIALGLPVPRNPLDVVRGYRDRMKIHRPIPPKTVAKGPVFENIDRDGEVDVLKFPVPFLHEHDGGRYIG